MFWTFPLIAFISRLPLASPTRDAPVYNIKPDNVFSEGLQYYRVLRVHEKSSSLYVGAMNNLYRLWMFNVNDTENTAFFSRKQLPPSEEARARCAYHNRNPEYSCQNHVRVIFAIGDDQLYVCSTNAYTPQVLKLESNGLSQVDGGMSGAAICPVDPNDNATAVWVENGNPSGVSTVYAGTVTDFTQTSRILYRPPLIDEGGRVLHPFMRTMHTDSKWLNEPQFVGSFDIGDYVYFFLRETAVEYMNCGKAVYSRVARICKNDLGGQHVLKQTWATFVKARLNCSLPGEFPFYFDHIQDIRKVKTDEDTLFYATFNTDLLGYFGSAVCVFRLRDIDQVLDYGPFKEQRSSSHAWLPLPEEDVPKPRPGKCSGNTLDASDSAMHFIKSHPLLDMAVSSLGNSPIFHRRQLILTHLDVDTVFQGEKVYLVVFAASDDGSLYKIVQWMNRDGSHKSLLAAQYRLPSSTNIHALALLKNEYLYVGQDIGVAQVQVSQCGQYLTCDACIVDPYCSYNTMKQQCARAHDTHHYTAGWITSDPENIDSNECSSKVKQRTHVLYPGESAYLECQGMTSSSAGVWTYNNHTLVPVPGHHLLTVDGGLVIVNASKPLSGHYECIVQRRVTTRVQLFVDDVNCQKPHNVQAYQAAYREWCREFQEYRHTMLQWKEWYEQNSQSCANPPNLKKLPSPKNFNQSLKKNHVTDAKR